MSRPIIDITGKKFGRLLVWKFEGIDEHRRANFLCLCNCGAERVIPGISLRDGTTRSCGCLRRERACTIAAKNIKHGHARRTVVNDRTYFSWKCMIQRCTNPAATGFKNYGGRGVRVCRRWRTFKNFYIDLGKRPIGTTLGRFNDSGNYCPSNCQWMTPSTQVRNRRRRT